MYILNVLWVRSDLLLYPSGSVSQRLTGPDDKEWASGASPGPLAASGLLEDQGGLRVRGDRGVHMVIGLFGCPIPRPPRPSLTLPESPGLRKPVTLGT